jgi:molybdopterin/thiamine biosynthesis adenylyltransferase
MSQEIIPSERAILLSPQSKEFAVQWESLMRLKPTPIIKDLLSEQLLELKKLQQFDYWRENLNQEFENDQGVWCYFSWLNQLIRIVSPNNYLLLRLARNIPKTEMNELQILRKKRIGIVGMSVGQSILRCLAIEGIGGHFSIADFDDLEITNLNRIHAGIHQSGLKKTTIASRFIAELDPYVEISIFNKGINPDNIEAFIGNNDLIIEECDDIGVKKLVRQHCKARGVPVLMDTSDQLMIDVERFDYDKSRPVFHGLIEKSTTEIPEIIRLLEPEKCSERGRRSLAEIGKKIPSWPQLASDVQLGSALTAKLARAILLGHTIPSGRFRCDIMQLFQSHLEHR